MQPAHNFFHQGIKPNDMKKLFYPLIPFWTMLVFSSCQTESSEKKVSEAAITPTSQSAIADQRAMGEHLVLIAGCHDCHTPKKMGPKGPVWDMDRALSGHPAQQPLPELDRSDLESKGVAATQGATAWVGPWGVSFAANLTSDATGIGNWTEEHFFTALRDGKFKGIPNNRPILPPMPVEVTREMTDDEIRAIFTYLKSTKPIKNLVPAPLPPVSMIGK